MTSGAKKTLQFGAVIGTRLPWTRNNNCVIVNKCELGLCNFTVLTKRIFNPPSCSLAMANGHDLWSEN